MDGNRIYQKIFNSSQNLQNSERVHSKCSHPGKCPWIEIMLLKSVPLPPQTHTHTGSTPGHRHHGLHQTHWALNTWNLRLCHSWGCTPPLPLWWKHGFWATHPSYFTSELNPFTGTSDWWSSGHMVQGPIWSQTWWIPKWRPDQLGNMLSDLREVTESLSLSLSF